MSPRSAIHSVGFITILSIFMLLVVTALVAMSGFEQLRITAHFYFAAFLIPVSFIVYKFSLQAHTIEVKYHSAPFPNFEVITLPACISALLGAVTCITFIIIQIVMLAIHGHFYVALSPTILPYVVVFSLIGIMLILCCLAMYAIVSFISAPAQTMKAN